VLHIQALANPIAAGEKFIQIIFSYGHALLDCYNVFCNAMFGLQGTT
jgi:hypothetical protein